MRAIDTRKALQELNRVSKRNGLSFERLPRKGAGSHQGIVFRAVATSETVTVVIPGHSDLSPGVQRELIRYVRGIVDRAPAAALVLEVLTVVFDQKHE